MICTNRQVFFFHCRGENTCASVWTISLKTSWKLTLVYLPGWRKFHCKTAGFLLSSCWKRESEISLLEGVSEFPTTRHNGRQRGRREFDSLDFKRLKGGISVLFRMLCSFFDFLSKQNADAFTLSQGSAPVWEDFVGKASKLHSALK